tara:strand:+ start:167 stop:364 length:198 start_codon:yes stop_codon:yes gene_type:complete
MGFGEVYKTTWWGLPQKDGWGGIYYQFHNTNVIENLLANTKARSTYYENVAGTINILTALQNCEI